MKKFYIKFLLSILLMTIPAFADSAKPVPGDFDFKVNERWKIKGWEDYSAILKITKRIDSKSYKGVISIDYILDDVLVGEKLGRVLETVKISVNKTIEIEGEKVEGNKNWVPDAFSLKFSNSKLLTGTSKDLKDNYFKGITFHKISDKSDKYITSDKIRGKWYLSEKNSKAFSKKGFFLNALKVSFQNGNTFIMRGESGQKDILLTYILDGRWKTDRNYLLAVLSDIRPSVDLNYQSPRVKYLDTHQIRELKKQFKPRMHKTIKRLKNIFTKEIMEKQGVFKIVDLSEMKLTLQRGKEVLVFYKQM